MALTETRAFLNEVQYLDDDFAEYHMHVFGTMGTFDATNSGLVLSVTGGGLLAGGFFNKLAGNEDITLPANATKFVNVSKAKADADSAVTFTVDDAPLQDTDTLYRCVAFRCLTTADSIRVLDVLGGNPTAQYKSLYQRVDNLSTLYSGTGDPANSLGNDGDAYIKYT